MSAISIFLFTHIALILFTYRTLRSIRNSGGFTFVFKDYNMLLDVDWRMENERKYGKFQNAFS